MREPSAELLHEREEVGHAPVLGDLAVAHAHVVYGLEVDLAHLWGAQIGKASGEESAVCGGFLGRLQRPLRFFASGAV